jgi:hypothetical protein
MLHCCDRYYCEKYLVEEDIFLINDGLVVGWLVSA